MGAFPPAQCWNGYSQYAPLLMYLEQAGLYNSLNMSLYVSIANDYPAGAAIDAHYTAAVTKLGVLACPSDPDPSWNSATTSYPGNAGYGPAGAKTFAAGLFDYGPSPTSISAAQISDGTSNTVAVSEWVRRRRAGCLIGP